MKIPPGFIFLTCSLSLVICFFSFKSEPAKREDVLLSVDYERMRLKGRIEKLTETDSSASQSRKFYLFDTLGQTIYYVNVSNGDTAEKFHYQFLNGRMSGWTKINGYGPDSVVCLYDNRGNRIENVHYKNGVMVKGVSDKFYYNADDFLIKSAFSIKDLNSSVSRYFYGADKKLKRSTDLFSDIFASPSLDKKTYNKDENCILDSIFDGGKFEAVTQINYDTNGNVTSVNMVGRDFKMKQVNVYEYDATGNWIKCYYYNDDKLIGVKRREMEYYGK